VLVGGDVEPVIAAGTINDVGIVETESHTVNPDDGSVVVLNRFVLRGGTLLVTFRGQATLTPTSGCVTRTAIDGTFEVTGGTDRYLGASGGGTFKDRGTLVASRGLAGCSEDGLFRATIRATGTISAPSA
jgi:hypothetical protein